MGDSGAGRRPSIGLVLGAGGVVGQAYQAGVLAALERETGWDPRAATVIVGTSAGSVTGAALRVGVPATDLAASLYGVATSRRRGRHPAPHPPRRRRAAARPRRCGRCCAPGTCRRPPCITRVARRPLAFRPEVAAMTLLPRGQVDISERARGLDEHIGDRWPDGLRICAVRRSDGARVVFGRPGAPPARLAPAVLASCAIPGYFRPVTIEGTEYVDGGVHSVTNADVLRSEGLDLVVIVSSMSAAQGNANGADGLLRRTVHRRMEREIARLEEAGHGGGQPGARGRVTPGRWGCGPWPRTGAPGSSRPPTRRPGGGSWPAPFLASLGEPAAAASAG